MILTTTVGTNAELIAKVAKLYLASTSRVADVTFGKGAFWKNFKPKHFFPSDINPIGDTVKKVDFRQLPYDDKSMDVVVLDPPFLHGGGTIKKSIASCYGNNASGSWSHKKIIDLYLAGMEEAWRVLKPNGYLWVKCQDEIESGKQRRSHIEIYEDAKVIGFIDDDLFMLVQVGAPAQREQYQLHARKNSSFLWIFRKNPKH